MPFWSVLCFLLFLMVDASAEAPADSVRPYTVDRISPKYPVEAAKHHIEGHVLVEALVNQSGLVESIKILESEPQHTFDSTVIEAVSQWSFTPVCGAKFSEPLRIKIPVAFKLASKNGDSPIVNLLPPLQPILPAPIASRSDKGIRIKRPVRVGCAEERSASIEQ